MEDTTNLVLEHLRAIRSDIARLANRMDTMGAELTAIRQHLGGVVTIQDHDNGDIAEIKSRLDRIERRLELTE
jgi:butyrate kinase